MNKLDKHFENWKPETDCVVIGCSPSLKWYDFGKYIDQFSTVIRINICLIPEMFSHTGKKIDIWATTGNDRWDGYNPIDINTTKEVWTRNDGYKKQLTENGTLNNFRGPLVVMDRGHFHFFGIGLGTGLITISNATQKYKKITIIGHTFYLESTDNKCYDFHSELEDEEHKKNRLGHHYGNKYGLKSLKYVTKWISEEKIILLNPYEYNNLRGV